MLVVRQRNGSAFIGPTCSFRFQNGLHQTTGSTEAELTDLASDYLREKQQENDIDRLYGRRYNCLRAP